jgi:hypothetical protein
VLEQLINNKLKQKSMQEMKQANLLSQAMRSADPNKGPGLQGIYEYFF